MKVDLEKITLGHSPLTDSIFAGTSIGPGVWRNKVDVTNPFLACVLARWAGYEEVVEDGNGNAYKIKVEKLTKKEAEGLRKKHPKT